MTTQREREAALQSRVSTLIDFHRWLGTHRKSLVVSALIAIAHFCLQFVRGIPEESLTQTQIQLWLPTILLAIQAAVIGVLVVSLYVRHRPRTSTKHPRSTIATKKFYTRWTWLWNSWLALYLLWALQSLLSISHNVELHDAAERVATAYYASGESVGELAMQESEQESKQNPLDRRRAAIVTLQSALTLHGEKENSGAGMANPPPATLSVALSKFQKTSDRFAREDGFWGVGRNLLNNLQTLIFFLCFYVLARAPSPPGKRHAEEPIALGLVCIVIFTVLNFVCAWTPAWESQLKWFEWSSGFLAGAALALVVGRLQSKFINPPMWTITLFFVYAIIQPGWAGFGEHVFFMTLLTSCALLLKLLLYFFVYWIFDSGILLYYFHGVREILEYDKGERKLDTERRSFVHHLLSEESG